MLSVMGSRLVMLTALGGGVGTLSFAVAIALDVGSLGSVSRSAALVLAVVDGLFVLGLRGGSFATEAFLEAKSLLRDSAKRMSGVVQASLRYLFVFVALGIVIGLAALYVSAIEAARAETFVRAALSLVLTCIGLSMCSYALLGAQAVPFVRPRS